MNEWSSVMDLLRWRKTQQKFLGKNGYPHGAGEQKATNGASYVGEYVVGKMHGRGKITRPDGRSYEGFFKNDAMSGHGCEVLPDGSRYAVDYEENKLVASKELVDCSYCREYTTSVKACSKCMAVRYCQFDCQKAHWRAGHSKECDILANVHKSRVAWFQEAKQKGNPQEVQWMVFVPGNPVPAAIAPTRTEAMSVSNVLKTPHIPFLCCKNL